jgi:hypothetical protein
VLTNEALATWSWGSTDQHFGAPYDTLTHDEDLKRALKEAL